MERWARALHQPVLPLGEDGKRITACKEHITLSKEAAKEGMVLLKNENGALPLKKGSRIALFGKASFDYVKGGGGSGDVTVSYTRNLYEGFRQKADKVTVFEELAAFYRENVQRQYGSGKQPGMTEEPEVPHDLIRKARAFTDTAVISICRFSGEGWDRNEEDFNLTAGEAAMVKAVKAAFGTIIVVLNVGGIVDTEWFRGDSGIQAALLAWQGGMEGGLAAAELLIGEGNPCGKLSDTFARRLEDYPSSYNFRQSEDYVEYTDDIYVGYRYFETIPGAAERVNYPFGFGLSYTTFALNNPVISLWMPGENHGTGLSCGNAYSVPVEQWDGICKVSVDVCNTGTMAGKEVVQLYYSAPQGKLGKPARELAAFQKTRLLQPGETQKVTLAFPIKDMASYDDLGKVEKSAYVLEKGEYHFYIGTSVRDTITRDFAFALDMDVVVDLLSSKMAPVQLSERMLSDGSLEKMPQGGHMVTEANVLEPLNGELADGLTPIVKFRDRYVVWHVEKDIHKLSEVAEGSLSMEEFLAQLSDSQLADLLGGAPNTGVANTFGYGNLPEYGVPSIMTADGPAGLRILPECGVCTTAWPCATLLACTWNPELAEQIGAAGGMEVKENNIGAWLTPAVNIHRSPLCGRNFEYYSEDPYLTGKMAAAMVTGIQGSHVAATVKHFALNNKEGNRKNSDSRASERAIREIYLKAFEIIVKEAKPWSIMSSYNIINGRRASENRELLEDILRGEWGFDGMVTTDWWTYGEHYKEVKAGNDVKMGCGFPERLLEAMEKGVLSRAEMEICAKRVLEFILKLE